MSGIHQFVPMLHRHDAVGEHAMAVRDLLRAAGVESRIYSEIPDPHTADQTAPYLAYDTQASPGDVLVYQFATQSAIVPWLVGRSEPVVVNYHSVTPPEFFAPWNNAIARLQVQCLHQLSLLAPRTALGVAVSHFDEAELAAAGYANTMVVPVVTAARRLPSADPEWARRLGRRRSAGGSLWLSVGRLVPNKAHHAVIAALFAYRQQFDPQASLVLVGSPSEPNYAAALRRYAIELGLGDAVVFASGLSDASLAACYEAADVLVMLSRHEGFGVPLVEAMRHRVPIVAYAAGAVPEVLGDVGVLLPTTQPTKVAVAIHELLTDAALRDRVTAGTRDQLGLLRIDAAGSLLVDALTSVTAGASHPNGRPPVRPASGGDTLVGGAPRGSA